MFSTFTFRGRGAAGLLGLAVMAAPVLSGVWGGEEIVGVLRNIDAVTEADGFSLELIHPASLLPPEGDFAPPQIFAVIRPEDKPLVIGRLFTSSDRIRLEAPKRAYAAGEPARLTLRNIAPTPPDGHVYTIFVQVLSPVQATLRHDIFLQSRIAPPPDAAGEPAEAVEPGDPASLAAVAPEAGIAAGEPAEIVDPADPARPALAEAEANPAAGEGEEISRNREADGEKPLPAGAGTSGAPEESREMADRRDKPAPTGREFPRDPSLPFVSLITLGVTDMNRVASFYERLGWRRLSRDPADSAVFFQLNGQALVLYPLPDLLREQNMTNAKPAAGGVTLALLVAGKAEVEKIFENFLTAGGRTLREPTEMPSGAVTCYVADPEGNPWEISWVPSFRRDAEAGLWLP
ncbi:MAG: VOC family protein [Planctomycetota bacterium]|nr:VOC family protein [Planctomycetota bacterium]